MSDELDETGLVDVGDLTLSDLCLLDESALSHALRSLLEASDDAMGPIAGFNQSIDGLAPHG
ncbi:FxSxx-COOH cyclophane-containing RiPP peptide [Nonomuraea jiangxiensis]|uniref:FXSXX-COOH protein n=1 Tax=Nonomuraea jiangxiensis TaxID=633440 RepID=A0A1G9DA01_9ACTN|nr:FxSxx-COOH cyclophane-containing RiPP peptide [Nonomuraea jiangxiensis]SDK60732.1 FXSXX-COOH protein [Nonomuraea jiangxiensis]